ncbi:MAG: nucleotide pyrophosphohydrolase [Clostridiales bacterium GWC2_40_7]|nr:MAG: nucleotide pyrophosphohydrolase [Clostridiales bacterium GWC2_40_7]
MLISELKAIVKEFCESRDWNQYHNPKDLSIGIVTEAAELIEHFRFKSQKEMVDIMENADKRTAISEELSDILFFVLRFAQMYDIDLAQEFQRKMSLNEKKYPVEKFKGSNKKYTEA